MKTVRQLFGKGQCIFFLGLIFNILTNSINAQSQTRYGLYQSGPGHLFQQNDKVGLCTSPTFSSFMPDANFNIKLVADIRPSIQDPIIYNPFLVELGYIENQLFKTTAYVSILDRETNGLYGIHQYGPEHMINLFSSKLSIGYASPYNEYPYLLSVNGNILLKNQLTFLHDPDTHKAGISWETKDLDDTFVFTNYNSNTQNYSYPLILDPMSGVTTQGLLKADSIMISKGAGENKVLVSDQYGNGIWTDASSMHDDDWLISSVGKKGVEPPNPTVKHSLYFNDKKYLNVGIGTDQPLQKLHIVDGNILISRAPVEAPGSLNGSILFGDFPSNTFPNGEWGIEYYHEGLNFWKVGNDTWTGQNNCLFIKNDGNVGVATEMPLDKLQVNEGFEKFAVGSANIAALGPGSAYFGFNLARTKAGWLMSSNGTHNGGVLNYGDVEGNHHFVTVPSATAGSDPQTITDASVVEHIRMTVTKDGDVGIGTTNTHGYKLAVKGRILCENLKVQLEADWPDFVFNKDYSLQSLKEVEHYITQNNRLPGVPSAQEIKQDGVDIGQMNAILLQKVEELTRYIIDQQKQIEKQQQQLDELKKALK